MKIIVLDGYTLAADGNSWEAMRALGEVEIHHRSSPDELVVRARGAAVLITNKARIPAEVIDNSRELRFIAVSATGFATDSASGRRH